MRISVIQLYWFYKATSPPDGELACYVVICRCALFVGADAVLDFIDVGINACYSNDVDYITNRGTEVDEVDGLVQTHLNRANDFHICIKHLQHLIAGTC